MSLISLMSLKSLVGPVSLISLMRLISLISLTSNISLMTRRADVSSFQARRVILVQMMSHWLPDATISKND